jgi:hypothetical protein
VPTAERFSRGPVRSFEFFDKGTITLGEARRLVDELSDGRAGDPQ